MQADLNEEQKKYLSVHEPRFNRVLEIIEQLDLAENSSILDVGPSTLTEMIREKFPQCDVHTLGITGDNRDGGHLPGSILAAEKHTEYNLNNASDKESWPKPGKFNLVICAEVMEHLHTAPEYIFRFFSSLMRSGGVLIIQTPNAAALIKRLSLLLGKNPYERIRLNAENPGHFREYTTGELREIAESAGFNVQMISVENYFRMLPVTWKVRGYRFLQKMLGKKFNDGITLVCRL